MSSSALSRWRKEGAARVAAWLDEAPINREPGSDRQMLTLWHDGHEVPAIAQRLTMPRGYVDKRLRRMIDLYAYRMPRGTTQSNIGAPDAVYNPFLDDERALQRRTPQRPPTYKAGDTKRQRILDAIPALTLLKGEPPSSREIQTAIASRSNIDRYLVKMVTDGDIRRAPSGRGYELVAHRTDQRGTLDHTG